MGTSNWQNISYCIDILREIKPKSILDIGVGFGRWGMLCREFLELWDGRVFREEWILNIEGVEIFARNIDDYHKYFYNQIHVADAYELVKGSQRNYDLIIIGDVLEHFDKDRGIDFLHRCLDISRFVLLNVPLGDQWPQNDKYGNEFERHRSIWNEAELDQFPVKRKMNFKDYIQRDFATYLFSR